VIGKISLVEFLGGLSFSSFLFHYLSFHIGLDVFFLICCLVCLFFLTVRFLYQVVFQLVHFHFLYIENTKKYTFCIMEFDLLGSYH
jgi:hypothetical protein